MSTQKTDNKKVLLLMVPAVIVAVVIILFATGAMDKKEEVTTTDTGKTFIEKGVSKDSLKGDRPEIYEEYNKEEREKEDMYNRTVSSDNDFFYGNKTSETSEKDINNEFVASKETTKEPVKTTTGGNATTKKAVAKKTTTQTQSQEVVKEEVKQPEVKKSYYGFGVVGGSSSTGTQTKSTSSTNEYWIEADLEKDHLFSDKSQPVMNLKREAVIGGRKYGKMSTLYGYSSLTSAGRKYFFEVTVNRIKNSLDNKMYEVNLEGYNENYQKGIPYEGKIEAALNESATESVDNSSSNVNTTSGITQSAVNTAARTAAKAVKKQPETPINEGYRMYFKEIKER